MAFFSRHYGRKSLATNYSLLQITFFLLRVTSGGEGKRIVRVDCR